MKRKKRFKKVKGAVVGLSEYNLLRDQLYAEIDNRTDFAARVVYGNDVCRGLMDDEFEAFEKDGVAVDRWEMYKAVGVMVSLADKVLDGLREKKEDALDSELMVLVDKIRDALGVDEAFVEG